MEADAGGDQRGQYGNAAQGSGKGDPLPFNRDRLAHCAHPGFSAAELHGRMRDRARRSHQIRQ